jgi:hypothetical protein
MTNLANMSTAAGEPSIAAAAATIRVIRSLEEVEEIREIWAAWKSHRDSEIDFCLRFVWSRPEVIRPHVIVLYRNGRPDAMLVGRLEQARIKSKIGYLYTPGIPARILVFAYGSLLGDASAENGEQCVRAIMTALQDGEADVALLDHIGVDSALHRNALALPGLVSRDRLAKVETHYTMKLPGDMKEVYAGLSANHRSELKRKAKKLLAAYPDAVRTACYLDPTDDLIAQVEEIAKKTYQRGLGVGFHPGDQTNRRLRVSADKGWLRIYFLYLAEVPCAFWIGTVHEGSFCSDYLAFDPKYKDHTPGMFLLTRVVEEFCQAGVKEIDFGFGEGRYKEQFGNTPAQEASVFIFAPSFKGLILNATRTFAGITDRSVKKFLERTDLLPRLKKLWRNRVAKPAATASN